MNTMTTGYTRIIFGGQELDLKNLNRTKVPGTIKQKVGGSLVQHKIPAKITRDWQLSGNGVIFDTSSTGHSPFYATAQRAVLEAYDDLEKRQYNDGLVTGSYIITNLQFNDSDEQPLSYEYSISLIEYNQA